ncbi:glutamine--fructose-6-phosphate transaminase (isomerizing) [Agathobaculum sp. NTUH-O15-33]|uniref:glutamine--fructose-6-phosphate transaminase (isomerizing) n=1 Tax=Agathobaculum sp. NTUH-O15-33 TaxID=3079302 RepID=UPI002958A887|nr:glutamine--fructose-6-phosphate transaminase (isomerizing) [Agathobaculum sp. NTUH-O15-33]WNX86479.1 glutamine--fructose-6-phosphate transaminase (isomerizing) [Agathobaculum sp. NTUH-O15-33]
MCGIVGFTGRENALPVLIKGLYSLEYRGYDSAGVAAFTKEGLRVVKTQGRIANLEEKIKEEGGLCCTCGIGHTRWATHGEPSDRNSHPHLGGKDGMGKVAVVHNGIIENYQDLRTRLEKHGYAFQSETDTETVAHLIDYLHTGKQEDLAQTVLAAVQRIRGSYALGVVSLDNPDEIVAARRDNPLVIGLGKEENMIASDITAIISRTDRYIILDDNEVAIVRPDGVTVMNEFGETLDKPVQTVTWDMSAAEKGGYEHFMIKEIMEQPKAVGDTVRPRIQNDSILFEECGLTDERLREIENIHIVACGSALHAGMVGKRVIESMCRVRCSAEVASEFRYENPIIGKKDLCIVVSQSGETADTLAAMRLAKQAGAFTVAIVNVVSSTIAREADGVLYTWAGPEIAVATTKAYSAQLAALYMISVRIARVRGHISIGDEKALCAELRRLPRLIEQTLACKEQMQRIATRYANRASVFFLGRGLDYAAALEASLKLKEISYVHSEAYAAGELKHGTISLIEKGTLVVALATQPALFEKTVSNIREVVSRGASVVLVTTDDFTGDESVCRHIVRLPKCLSEFSASLSIIPLQLLAYYVAVERSCDVDKPRNLAKSVTVE